MIVNSPGAVNSSMPEQPATPARYPTPPPRASIPARHPGRHPGPPSHTATPGVIPHRRSRGAQSGQPCAYPAVSVFPRGAVNTTSDLARTL